MHPRLLALNNAWHLAFGNWADVYADPRCRGIAEWLVRSIWNPNAPDAVPLGWYGQGAPGSGAVDFLCQQFNIP